MTRKKVTQPTEPRPAPENESAIERVLRESEGLRVTAESKARAVTGYRKALAALEEVQAALAVSQEAMDEASAEMVRQFKRDFLKMGGQLLQPSGRGDRIFYKRMSEPESVTV